MSRPILAILCFLSGAALVLVINYLSGGWSYADCVLRHTGPGMTATASNNVEMACRRKRFLLN